MPETQNVQQPNINNQPFVQVNPVPTQAAPVQPVTAQTTVATPAPVQPKRRSGCGMCLLTCFVIVLVSVGVIGAGGYFVYKKVTVKPDLGIKYTSKDFDQFLSQSKIKLEGKPEEICFVCPVKYEGSQLAKVKLTDAQASAWIDTLNSGQGLVSGTQIKFTDGKVSVVTNVGFQGKNFPISATGEIVKKSDNEVNISLQNLKVGALPIPASSLPDIEKSLNEFVNQKLAEIENLKINKLEIKNGYLDFDGVVPQSVSGMKDKVVEETEN